MSAPPKIRVDDEYVLGEWTTEDAAAHRSFAEDPVAARFLGWSVEEARAQSDAYYVGVVRRFQDEWVEGSRLSLAIRCVRTGEAVGAVELRPVDDTVEASYLIAAGRRGHGLAARALGAFLDWATRELPVTRASLSCHVDNLASQRVAEHCGFTLTARERDELRFARLL
jgi:RimJ/RimL family protein N-acetyltransferase